MARKTTQESSSAKTAKRISDSDLTTLKQLGRYQVQKKLGQGGMGTVYLALDPTLNRLVALKILPAEKAENKILVKRFKAEGQAAAQLTHDNIVRVYESGEADGLHYIAMEYVEGTDVQRLIKKRNRIPIRRSTEIITQVARALDHAAQASIVHRDIKPSNLLITQAGVVKLTDLGLARIVDDTEETSITRAGTTVGTVDYMSPEQARSSKAADIRSDLYSLGCTWYHMLTGSPPYPEGSVTNKLHAHAVAQIPDPRDLNESVPEAIVGVITRMMAKNPEDRYQSVAELLEDLEAVKTTKREIKAEDLAALAGADDVIEEDADDREDAESPVIPPRRGPAVREVESSDESDEAAPTKKRRRKADKASSSSSSGARNGSSKSTSSGVDSLPPREKRKLEDVEGQSASQLGVIAKYIGLACALIAVVSGAWYGVAAVSSSFSQSGADDKDNVDLTRTIEEVQAERASEAAESNGNGGEGSTTSPENAPRKLTATPAVAAAEEELSAEQIASLPKLQIVDSSVKEDDTHFHTISDALGKISDKDVVIELATTGTFVWEQPVSVENRNVIFRAADGTSGRIILNSAGAMTDGLIRAKNAHVMVHGLHFGLPAYDLPGASELRLFHLQSSDLRVRDSSFTIEESRAAPVILCSYVGQKKANQLEWKRSLVRGELWQPFLCLAEQLQVSIDDSLFLIGGAPLLDLRLPPGTSSGDAGANTADGQYAREVSMNDTIVVCQNTPLVMMNTRGRNNPPPTQFRLNRSHFVATSPAGQRPLVSIANWPENVLGGSTSGSLSRVNWISENSSFSGWASRLNATTNRTRAVFKIDNEESWQKFWGNSGLFGDWNNRPVRLEAGTSLAHHTGNDLKKLGVTAAVHPHEQTLERLARLSVPELPRKTWRAEAAAMESRPRPVADPFNDSVKRMTVNLSDPRVDLGKFLASETLPDPVVVEAVGFGNRSSSPIQIANRTIKIVFKSEAGKYPLTLRPEGTRDSGEAPWIRVQGGHLAIEDGIFRVDPEGNQPLPTAWLAAEGADVVLRKCYVTAPATADRRLQSLIQAGTAGAAGSDRSTLLLDRTFLSYGGDLIATNLRRYTPFVRNSVLASQNHLLAMSYSGSANETVPGYFELTSSTLSARDGALHFDVPASGDHKRPLVSGRVQECAFVPAANPGRSKAEAPSVLSASFDLKELPSRVWWWGDRNGFSPEINQQILGQPLAQSWSRYWGDGHVERPLFGPNGVMLIAGTIDAKELKPSSFSLFKDCQATKWGPGDTKIGADCDQLDVPEYDPEKPQTPPKGKPPANDRSRPPTI
ncbi:serine/threonine-protein kinase [Rubinisphaera margarita]|uniref:serine/threonine-protein kinase n=1 Tax=Rubinisphaera margarita TaxID=2909586 RepID=UPI001EE86E08|nr:serine/threonine-protein kinase [Rubinisphaera margarita]MCG6158470.1 serine/threonine protein kinase [Rubinisphaera margarita]